jgi:dynein heavy chain
MDSTRSEYLLRIFQQLPLDYFYRKQLLLVGVSGTAKTSTILMFCDKFDNSKILKKINFSSATLPKNFQEILEDSVEKKTGKIFQPPNGKLMCVLIDDMSMPEINTWGD